jgi:hypothetical protein
MALYMALGGITTMEPGETLTVAWEYVDKKDHGPNYVSASFVSRYGTPTVATLQTSVQSVRGHEFIYYGQLQGSGNATAIQFNVGNFE